MADRPFARVYYIDLERDYPSVWRDDAALATWTRLLATADAMWPAVPEVPRSARSALVSKLVTVGLVILVPPFGYRIKGLDAERTARSNAASNAARSRWGNADGSASAMPNQSSPDQSNPAHPIARETLDLEEPEDEAITWLAKHGCYVKPGNGYHQHLVLAVERHGSNAVIGMFDRLARAGTTNGDIKGFIFGASDALKPKVNLSEVEAEVRAEEREEVRRNRKPDPVQAELKARLLELHGPDEVGGPLVVRDGVRT